MFDYKSYSVKDLRFILIEASDRYYNKSKPIISDQEFDSAKDYLRSISPNDPFFKMIGSSVTQSEWTKAKHNIPMSSLNKVNTLEEFKKWFVNKPVVVQTKLDGISIAVEYDKEGNFSTATTRGDGFIGEDITQNVKRMKGVPEKINKTFNDYVSFRGEIVLKHDDFEFVNQILEKQGEEPFKNVRNAASGIAKRLDGKFSEYLTVIFYDTTLSFETEYDKIKTLKELFPNVVDSSTPLFTIDQIYSCYTDYVDTLRASLNWDVDGLVIRYDDIAFQHELCIGEDTNPKGQIAWKFPNMTAKTKIIRVDWQLGTSGRITPVAILEPVKLGGVTIQRASLSNYSIFKSFNLHYGDELVIERCNDVIPGVVRNLGGGTLIIGHIETCPHCNTKTTISDKFLICENKECSGNVIGALKKWSDNVFTAKGVAGKTIELLFEYDLVYNPVDFYKITEADLVTLPKIGFKKAQTILSVIDSGRKIKLEKFIDGLNFKNFGESRAKLLIERGYDTWEKISNITKVELLSISGIGDSIVADFYKSLEEKSELINSLLKIIELYVDTKTDEVSSSSIFSGKSFCFTGKIEKLDENGDRYTRKMMEELVVKNGGSLEKVKKGLTYLVQADPESVSDKSQTAKKLNIEILSEEKFFEMIGL